MTDIQRLVQLCQFNFHIEYNPHKSDFVSAEKYISDYKSISIIDEEDIEPDVLAQMIEKDAIVVIYFYCNAVGSWRIYHHDIDLAITEMIRVIEKDNSEP